MSAPWLFKYADVDENGNVIQGSQGRHFASSHSIKVCGVHVFSSDSEQDWSVVLARIVAEIKRTVTA
jgi:hypothetical protein